MKGLVLLFFICSSLSVYPQQKRIGILGGVSLTNISKQRFDNETEQRSRLHIGLSYENHIKKHLTFGVDLCYSQRGFDLPVYFTDNNGERTGEGYTVIYSYDYISVPLKIGWQFGEQFYGFGNVGVVPAIVSKADFTIPTYNVGTLIYEGENINTKDLVRRFDAAMLVQVGGGYKVNKNIRVFGITGFQHSLTPFTTRFHFSQSNLWHYGVNFSLGVNYAITNKKMVQ